jgi:hypothetical protein
MMQHSGSRTVAADEAATGSGNGVAREPSWWRRAWRRLMPAPDAELVLAQLNRQLAVLEGARAELEVGWVQGGWWSVRLADGGHRLVTGDAGGSPAQVDGSCLVGALARAGSSSGAGRAVDAVYDALWASRGQPTLPGGLPPVPSPEVRMARMRTLTQWNDRAGRSRAEVLALVDRAINATIMDLMSVPRPQPRSGAAGSADRRIGVGEYRLLGEAGDGSETVA